MGLDVYVGTLTRYYAGAWETIIQRTARETATPLRVIRQNHPSDAITDPIVIENTVNMWREALNAGLQPNLNAPLAWTEGMAPPYFTDKPALDCYGALLVWAAHEEHPGLPLPSVTADDWRTDAAVQRSQSEGFVSRYGQLLYGPELWLPGDFSFTFQANDLAGVTVAVGSVNTLLAQLCDLNDRTWKADASQVHAFRLAGAATGSALEASAKFAFSLFLELAQAAAKHQLPMKLDY